MLAADEIRVLKDESTRLSLDQSALKEKIKENKEKIKLNNQLPYLVSNIVEVLDVQVGCSSMGGCSSPGFCFKAFPPVAAHLRLQCAVLTFAERDREGRRHSQPAACHSTPLPDMLHFANNTTCAHKHSMHAQMPAL